MIYRTASLIAAIVAFGSPAVAASADQQAIEALSKLRFTALITHDTAAFSKIYTDDFVAYGGGQKLTIGFLKALVAHAPSDWSITPDNYEVIVSKDGTLAVATHTSRDVWEGQKTDNAYTEIYVRDRGEWRLKIEQFEELAPPPKPA